MTRGLTWGAFDLFHIGHLNLLKNAKNKCDELVVCVSSDEYIYKNKYHYPVFNFADRIKIVSELKCVDFTDAQTLDFTKKDAIKKYNPDILFVGSDWAGDYTGEGLGVSVVYLPYTKNISTSNIIWRIQNQKN